MRKSTALAALLLASSSLLHADPSESLIGFEIFSHDSRILADRSLGAVEAGAPLPWKKPSKATFYLKVPVTMENPQMVPTALKSIQVPGLDFTDDSTLDDARFAAIIKPLLPAPQFQFLKLEGTKVTDKSIALINQLKNIRVLSLGGAISDEGLRQLRLPQIQELKIGSGAITDGGMKALLTAKTLRRLDIADSAVTATGLQALVGIRLDQLRVGATFNDASINVLGRFVTLGLLDLSQSHINDISLMKLRGLTVLHTLFLPKHITNKGAEHLAKLQRLRRLDLSQTAITDTGIQHIAKLSRLEELALTNTAVTDASVDALLRLGQLRMLDVTGTGLSRHGYERLSGLQKLQVLALSSQSTLQLKDLKTLAGLQNLKTLAVNGLPLSTTVLAYFKSPDMAAGGSALGLSGGIKSIPETTALEQLPTEQIQERSRKGLRGGLYQIHDMESSLDHVVPAMETASIKINTDTEANFLGEIEVGVPGKTR